MSLLHTTICAALCGALGAPAWAGRPLAVDDAGVAEAASCYVELWATRAGDERGVTAAPACGLGHGLELGGDVTRPNPRDVVRGSGGLALKWLPPG